MDAVQLEEISINIRATARRERDLRLPNMAADRDKQGWPVKHRFGAGGECPCVQRDVRPRSEFIIRDGLAYRRDPGASPDVRSADGEVLDGEVHLLAFDPTCELCGGTGVISHAYERRCDACHGEGEILDTGRPVQCGQCRGLGRVLIGRYPPGRTPRPEDREERQREATRIATHGVSSYTDWERVHAAYLARRLRIADRFGMRVEDLPSDGNHSRDANPWAPYIETHARDHYIVIEPFPPDGDAINTYGRLIGGATPSEVKFIGSDGAAHENMLARNFRLYGSIARAFESVGIPRFVASVNSAEPDIAGTGLFVDDDSPVSEPAPLGVITEIHGTDPVTGEQIATVALGQRANNIAAASPRETHQGADGQPVTIPMWRGAGTPAPNPDEHEYLCPDCGTWTHGSHRLDGDSLELNGPWCEDCGDNHDGMRCSNEECGFRFDFTCDAHQYETRTAPAPQGATDE